jgi:hypothetical protein
MKKLILASSLISLTFPNVWADEPCNPEVAGTLMAWANCVNQELGKLQAMIGDAEVLPPNLIRNSYMALLKGKAPAGYYTNGNVTLEAVHPFTKGFEGPYIHSKPQNAANSIEEATKQHPYWFGRYNKGQRASRGGLADGWNGLRDGKILKITGDNSGQHTIVYFPFERNILANRVRFKAWIKIVSAKKVGFGVDSGYRNRAGGLRITKEQADKAPDGWYRIDNIIGMSRVTNLTGNAFALGIEADGSPFEVYLALPYLGIVDDNSWLPSVSDTLLRDGLTIRPDNSNVGIGTTNPTEKLEVKGNIKTAAFTTGDIFFQKDGQTLWQMFEDEKGLYLKQLKTGKTYRLMLEEIK